MKKIHLLLPGIAMLFLAACNNNTPGNREESITEREPCLEDILNLDSEQELIKKYGKESVSYDTIWGAEGFYTMGTVLRVDERSRVEVMWMDSAARKGMISSTLVSTADYYADELDPGKWKSCTGVAVGMTLDELQRINGRPFTFSGFGWDYGGGVISWEGGTLEEKGLAVQLSEGEGSVELTDEESNQVLGDIMVMSDNKAVQKLKPRVWAISVAKIE